MSVRDEITGQYLMSCKYCGKEFKANRSNTKYCNNRCKQDNYLRDVALKKLVKDKKEAAQCYLDFEQLLEHHDKVGKELARIGDFVKHWTKYIDTPNKEALQDCAILSLEHYRQTQSQFRLYNLLRQKVELTLLSQVDIDAMSSNLESELLAVLPVSSIKVRLDPLEEDEDAEEEDDGDEFIQLKP